MYQSSLNGIKIPAFLSFAAAFIALLCMSGPALAEKLLYERTYSDAGPETEGQAIVQMGDGGLLIAATKSVPASGGLYQRDIMVIRTNASGDTLWTKTYGSAASDESAEGMTVTTEQDIVIAGYTRALPNGDNDALLLCIDETGNQLWSKAIGSMGRMEFATGVRAMNERLVVSGMSYDSTNTNADAWLFKTDGTGNVLWQKTFGGAEYDDAWDIELTPEGGYMLTGGTHSFANGQYDDAWLIKTDTGGNLIWRKTYGLADRVDWAWALTPVKPGNLITGYVFTGVKNTESSIPGSAYGSLHLVKVDTAGDVVWDKSITGPAGALRWEGFDVAAAPSGDLLIAGVQYSTSSVNLYAVRTDAAGTVKWDTAYAPAPRSAYRPRAITATADGGFAITGNIGTSATSKRIFVSKFGNALSVPNTQGSGSLIVYPNPAATHITIDAPAGGKLNLFNSIGQVVIQQEFIQGLTRFSVAALPAGVYHLVVSCSTGERISRQIVKE